MRVLGGFKISESPAKILLMLSKINAIRNFAYSSRKNIFGIEGLTKFTHGVAGISHRFHTDITQISHRFHRVDDVNVRISCEHVQKKRLK